MTSRWRFIPEVSMFENFIGDLETQGNKEYIIDMADADNGETEDSIQDESGVEFEGQNDDASLDTSAGQDLAAEDPELEAIKARVREMEKEAEKLKELQSEVERQMNLSSPTLQTHASMEDKLDADTRSVYVGNVDYGATAEELEQHFHGCGSVNRVTILVNKFTGHPKGFAYIEFADKDSVTTAMALDESLFRGRQIKVIAKRTNRPGISSTNRFPRSRRGFRSSRPRSRFSRFRRSSFYSPY